MNAESVKYVGTMTAMPRILRNRERIRRAVRRGVMGVQAVDEAVRRIERIMDHAEKLGWVSTPRR